ncbi:polysaccharide deacetylase family protein [Clostridium sp.]|uniref:polysaccharide deacetylase family protein n=1 Tax=Clostridium sp. TaxID=1506 RepID=UPI003D6DA82A
MTLRKKTIFLFTTLIILLFLSRSSHTKNIIHNSPVFKPLNISLKDSSDFRTSKIAYLTFDDGPTYVITAALLDILKKENVKATFFVVGKEIEGKESILKRIYLEGHSIGLHTYSHNFKKIYRSTEDLIYEMEKTSDKIQEVIGITPKIIRFPGGSSKHLNAFSLETLHKNSFKVYDWNVNIYDGINPNLSVSQLVENSRIIKGNKNAAMVLMHCNFNNKNTVKALPKIIQYYSESGYIFKAITEDTPEYYYKFRN